MRAERQASPHCKVAEPQSLTPGDGGEYSEFVTVCECLISGEVFLIYGEEKFVAAKVWMLVQDLINYLLRIGFGRLNLLTA
jgi:hypothetical protein